MSYPKATIRLAQKSDFEVLAQDTFGLKVDAYVIDLDGEAIGIAGIIHTESLQCFSKFTPEADKRHLSIMKLGRKTAKMCESYDDPVYAVASDKYNTSDKFLERLGFRFEENNKFGRVYRYGI